MKNTIFALCALFMLTNCKSDSKENATDTNAQNTQNLKKELVVKMGFKTNKSDEFKMVLYNIVPDEFQNKYIVIKERVILTSEMDNITVNFGDNISDNFRINFGIEEPKEIEISSIQLIYGPNIVNINPEDISTHFTFNEYISQDPSTLKLQTKKVGDKHNPIIYLKRKYLRELNK